MQLDGKILGRLNELLDMGERVLATRRNRPQNDFRDPTVDAKLAYQWATSAQSLLLRVFGNDSEHYARFQSITQRALSYSPSVCAQGVLKAAKDDYEGGQLFDVRQLIEAEIFDDFFEQADHLYAAGYYQAAAVIAGCVLEDGLRKLWVQHAIDVTDSPKLDKMNADLAKAGVYSKLIQKRITALADLRNKAAHGEWDQFSAPDVEDMLQNVRRLMEGYLA